VRERVTERWREEKRKRKRRKKKKKTKTTQDTIVRFMTTEPGLIVSRSTPSNPFCHRWTQCQFGKVAVVYEYIYTAFQQLIYLPVVGIVS